MQFGLSESQEFLKDSARKFFAGECPSAEMRRLMETDTAYDAALWSKLTDQGYTGIIFPESLGGVGLGQGRTHATDGRGRAARCCPGPFFSTVVLAGSVLEAVGIRPRIKNRYLAPICRGEARATVAILESNASWNPRDIHLKRDEWKAHRGKALRLGCRCRGFHYCHCAQRRVCSGLQGSWPEISPMSRHGLYAQTLRERNSWTLRRKKLALPRTSRRAFDIATAALAAELVGGMQRTLDITVEYAKTRKQFGKPIGMFQAVQHQCADMYLETESARSAVYYAGWALEENSPDAATAVSIAKMYASDAGRTVGNRGIQIHGGMGFTWENDVHLYYRRAKGSETAFGDATFHRERIASLVIDSGSVAAKSA